MGISINKGMVFDIKKFATDDGPGIRTTVFFKGCPLRCWWCHNPEGQLMTAELMHRRNICLACGECIKNCPKGVLSMRTAQLAIDRQKCDLCGRCAQACPTGALSILGGHMSVQKVMGEVERDLAFYEESGGGVTFSGGEPLMQLDFLNAMLSDCRARGIRTAVDTSGYASREAVERVRDKVDLFLYDVKTIDDKAHRRFTGVSNRRILENFRRLAEKGSEILVRFAIIPGINDDDDNVVKTAEFLVSCGAKRICLLPYHRTGIEKYRSLGRSYRLKALEPPSDQRVALIKTGFEAYDLIVTIGGGEE